MLSSVHIVPFSQRCLLSSLPLKRCRARTFKRSDIYPKCVFSPYASLRITNIFTTRFGDCFALLCSKASFGHGDRIIGLCTRYVYAWHMIRKFFYDLSRWRCLASDHAQSSPRHFTRLPQHGSRQRFPQRVLASGGHSHHPPAIAA